MKIAADQSEAVSAFVTDLTQVDLSLLRLCVNEYFVQFPNFRLTTTPRFTHCSFIMGGVVDKVVGSVINMAISGYKSDAVSYPISPLWSQPNPFGVAEEVNMLG